jgi:hypothetical protein
VLFALSRKLKSMWDESHWLPNGTWSTADRRVNMYIPEGELEIPRPYGSIAPFKPAVPGAAMRHYRFVPTIFLLLNIYCFDAENQNLYLLNLQKKAIPMDTTTKMCRTSKNTLNRNRH